MEHIETNTTTSGIKAILLSLSAFFLMIFWGMMTGMLMAIIGSFCYLAFIFPLIMGFGGKTMVDDVVNRRWIRTNRQKVLGAVLMVLAMFATLHYGRYLAVQVRMYYEVSESLTDTSDQENFALAKIFVDSALEEETGHTGFIGYMLLQAQTGISIGRFYSESRLTLSSMLAWLYWILEIGIVLWIVLGLKTGLKRGPRCEACGSRFSPEKHLGGTSPANEARLLALLEGNDLAGLGEMLEQDTGLPSLEVYMQGCDACGRSTSRITVRRASLGARGALQFSDISTLTLPPADSVLSLKQLKLETE